MTTQPDSSVIESLEPKPVWRFFADLSTVPRPSKHEEKIRAHVRKTAEDLGFKAREDRVGNIVIEAPASKGYENAPIIVLQGHVDMVCEKNAETEHDFDRDPIRLVIDKDRETNEQIVRAAGTTLGADNGIGLAMALAAATAPDAIHGPLEILCTVDEEMGMTGAGQLEPGFIKGTRLLNLDSEEDDVIYIGCAGGGDTTLTWQFDTQPIADGLEICRVAVSGLRSGHSGGDIHENRGNAIKTLVHALNAAGIDDLQIGAIAGGSKRNVIPRDAGAVVAGPRGTLAALQKAAVVARDAVAHEFAEPNAAINVESVSKDQTPAMLSVADSRRVLGALTGLPHGVLEMHQKVAGLVQTSNNLATVLAEPVAEGAKMHVTIGALSRSSVEGRLAATREQIAAVGRLAGAEVEFGHTYPGWEPNVDSPLLATCRRLYEQLFDEKPNVAAIHAGLECGIIGQRLGNLDMISFGPRIDGAHTPEERTYPASVRKSYKFLTAVLAELARG